MDFILNKISIEDFQEHDIIYSKNIQNKLDFYIEVEECNHKELKIVLYRNHPRIKEIIEKFGYENIDLLTTQKKKYNIKEGVYRLLFNEEKTMVICNGGGVLTIEEYNFNSKKQEFADFKKGKLKIVIDFVFNKETDNFKIKEELSKIGG